ncbi:MAG: hypothetical protein HC881_10400 [Leptolyngbyaceae cyanobacterium SL_7_1]|nr:hypothetical protein [Leptolyngbyaceae cyanobacterium SL_7_1]
MQTIRIRGELQLCGMDAYAAVVALLDDTICQNPSRLCLDLRELKFLNSSGIHMLLRFVLKVRNQGKIQLVVTGSEQIFWQGRSLRSFQQIMPQLNLQWV